MTSTPVREGIPALVEQVNDDEGGQLEGDMRNDTRIMSTNDVGCHYVRGGTCTTHGPGARRVGKPRRINST